MEKIGPPLSIYPVKSQEIFLKTIKSLKMRNKNPHPKFQKVEIQTHRHMSDLYEVFLGSYHQY